MLSSIFLVGALQQQPFHQVSSGVAVSAAGPVHRVVPGDTLSTIAPSMGESWQQLYAANEGVIGANPNLIYPGEVLHSGGATRTAATHTTSVRVTHRSHAAHLAHLAREQALAAAASAPVQQVQPVQQQAPQQAAVVQHAQPVQQQQQQAPQHVSVSGGSFEACVIARESAGNSQVMNSSNHYGLFQFDYSTWVSGGGNPADFGHASVSEQDRVFNVVYAARGTQPWAPSDGC